MKKYSLKVLITSLIVFTIMILTLEMLIPQAVLPILITIIVMAVFDMVKTTILTKNLKIQEEYKNQVFQSISHDLKSPISVINSHIEALDDGMINQEEFETVVRTQVHKLEYKVHSLLYLNKLNYMQDLNAYQSEKIDVKLIAKEAMTKFKYQRPDVNFKTSFSGNTVFRGNEEAWEAIIDNLLNNFMRYATSEIKITIKNNQIIFYNDGPPIDEKVLVDVFTPYKKGINGLFGLGLSIVKRTIKMLKYEIEVKNETKGVSFIIKEELE